MIIVMIPSRFLRAPDLTISVTQMSATLLSISSKRCGVEIQCGAPITTIATTNTSQPKTTPLPMDNIVKLMVSLPCFHAAD